MIKLALILMLALFSLVFHSESQATTYNNIVSCEGNSTFCNSLIKKRQAAYKAAKIHAEKYRNSGTYNIVIQSDSDDSVIEYSFRYFQDSIIIEGPDGRDIFMPSSHVNLSQENILSGQRKEAAKYLVSAKYQTKLLAQANTNLHVNRDGEIDIDRYCLADAHGEVGTRHIERLISYCSDFLRKRTNAFRDIGITIETSNSKAKKLFGEVTAETNAMLASINAKLGGGFTLEDARKVTQQLGGGQIFSSFDGYQIILQPQKSGKAKLVELKIHGNIIPITSTEQIDYEEFAKRAEMGEYRFDGRSAGFIDLMARRTGLRMWAQLRDLLDAGFVCDGCKVTIRDLPKKLS